MEYLSDDELTLAEIRPRFKIESELDPLSVEERINKKLLAEGATCYGKINHGFGTLHIPLIDQHYWSPQLTLHIEAQEKGSLIRGLYGPKPAVWTMFVFFYCIIGFSTLIIAVVGYANWTLGASTTLLWWVPVLLGIFLSLYLIAYFGKKMGKDQMLTLHRFITDIVH